MKSTLIPLTLATLFTTSCKPAKTEASAPEAAATTTEAIPFPKTTCLVSGEKLGIMGIPPELDYQGQQIKFCCKSCIPKFNADPEKYMAQLK